MRAILFFGSWIVPNLGCGTGSWDGDRLIECVTSFIKRRSGREVEASATVDVTPLVDAIVSRRLIEPAIFLFEMSKPLVGCLREVYALGEPLIQLFVGPRLADSLRGVLASSDEVEKFVSLLEASRS